MCEANALGDAQYRSTDDQERTLLYGPEDVDSLIDVLLAEPDDRCMAQVVSFQRPLLANGMVDHLLDVGVCRARQVGVIGFADVTGNYVTWNPSGGSDPSRYLMVGDTRTFPAHSEIDLDLVHQAVKEFLMSGGRRPESVAWQPHQLF